MKQEKGFSLIEVLIAGGLMVGVVMAAQALLTSTTKGAGDLEKRLRHRDLIDDIRFAFYDNARCLELVKSVPFGNGQGLPVPVHQGVAKEGADLSAYGIRVIKLSLQDVREIPQDTFTLMLPNRELAGQYLESGRTADLVLEAQLMGTANRPLKAVVVQRLTWLKRSGALTEELCFGNHDIPFRNGGGESGSSGSFGKSAEPGSSPSRSEGSLGITLYESPAEGGPKAAGGPGISGAPSRRAYCYLTEDTLIRAVGRERLVEGESVLVDMGGKGTRKISCEAGGVIRGS